MRWRLLVVFQLLIAVGLLYMLLVVFNPQQAETATPHGHHLILSKTTAAEETKTTTSFLPPAPTEPPKSRINCTWCMSGDINFCTFNSKDAITRDLCTNKGWHDCAEVETFNFSRTDRAVDIGANIGTCTILMAKRFKEVLAFEVFEKNERALRETLKENKLQNVQLFGFGIGDEDQQLKLGGYEDNFGATSAFDNRPGVLQLGVGHIRKMESPRADFYKIDCEGCEYQLLQKMFREGNFPKNIFIEVNEYSLKYTNLAFHDFAAVINKHYNVAGTNHGIDRGQGIYNVMLVHKQQQ